MFIKVTLKNFRIFESAEFVFDQRLSLISGSSGQGKTSIFMAIMFALTGQGKKLTRYGKSSCCVTLQLDDMVIVRTKGPNRLLVDKLEDAEAQSVLDRLCPKWHLGYMSQRLDQQSFIFMNVMDKMRFVQEMTQCTDMIDHVNKNCKDLIRRRKHELNRLTTELSTVQSMATSMKCVNSDQVEKSLPEMEGDVGRLKHVVGQLLTKKERLTYQMELRSKLLNELSQLPVIEVTPEHLEVEVAQVQAEWQKWQHYDREMVKLNKLKHSPLSNERIHELIKDVRGRQELQTCRLTERDLSQQLTRINERLVNSCVQSLLVCPTCQAEVELNGKYQLMARQKTSLSLSDQLARQLEKEASLLEVNLERVRSRITQLNEKINTSSSDSCLSTDTLTSYLEMNNRYERQESVCQSLADSLPERRPDQAHLSKLQSWQKTCLTRKEKERVLASLSDEGVDLLQLEEELKTKQAALSVLERDIIVKKTMDYWERVRDLSRKEKEASTDYPRAVKLQSLIKQAELTSMEHMVHQLNLKTQNYLDLFLDNVRVSLTFDASMSKMSLNLFQNEHECDLHSLSGGEMSRLMIAFTVAIAELNRIPFLLLDECFSSLDEDTSERVLHAIRDNFHGTILCIAHQMTTGLYDTVLELPTA